jgi:hypothetical protein
VAGAEAEVESPRAAERMSRWRAWARARWTGGLAAAAEREEGEQFRVADRRTAAVPVEWSLCVAFGGGLRTDRPDSSEQRDGLERIFPARAVATRGLAPTHTRAATRHEARSGRILAISFLKKHI